MEECLQNPNVNLDDFSTQAYWDPDSCNVPGSQVHNSGIIGGNLNNLGGVNNNVLDVSMTQPYLPPDESDNPEFGKKNLNEPANSQQIFGSNFMPSDQSTYQQVSLS